MAYLHMEQGGPGQRFWPEYFGFKSDVDLA